MSRYFRNIIVLMLALSPLVVSARALAGFGPGYTSGWPEAVDGLTGYLTDYTGPTGFYTPSDSITVIAVITNPSSNSITVTNKPVYVMVNRVLESPSGTSVTDGLPALSESTLFSNNQTGDLQALISATNVGTITLSPGQSTQVSYTFQPSVAGYYQIDFADRDLSGGYTPGSILAAGYVRVLEDTDSSSSDDGDGTDSHSSSNNNNNNGGSNNESTNNVNAPLAPVFAFNAPAIPLQEGEVPGQDEQPVEQPTQPEEPGTVEGAKTQKPEVAGTNSCSEQTTSWIWVLLGYVLVSVVLIGLKLTDILNNGTYFVAQSISSAVFFIIDLLNKCSCADPTLCVFTPWIIVILYALSLLFTRSGKNSRA